SGSNEADGVGFREAREEARRPASCYGITKLFGGETVNFVPLRRRPCLCNRLRPICLSNLEKAIMTSLVQYRHEGKRGVALLGADGQARAVLGANNVLAL